jgi:hypothetical protein
MYDLGLPFLNAALHQIARSPFAPSSVATMPGSKSFIVSISVLWVKLVIVRSAGVRPTASQHGNLQCLLSHVYSIEAASARLLTDRAAWFEAVGAFAYLAVDNVLGYLGARS